MDDAAAQIDRRLSTALIPGSPNGFTASELRGWAVAHLRRYADEATMFPELLGKPHWNLWMRDAALEGALFAVLMFWPDGVEFCCGTGESFAVQRWSGDASSDPAGLVDELRRHFRVLEDSLKFDRSAAEAWLGRGW